MAQCKICGASIGTFSTFGDGLCKACNLKRIQAAKRRREMGPEAAQAEAEKQSEIDREISSVVITTEAVSPFEIIERLDIVTAECAYGMNIFKDLFAGVRDIVGGRSESIQKTMRDARKTTLFELRREAHAIGANAVVGVDLDYVELSGAGNMVMLVASGTAVRAKLD